MSILEIFKLSVKTARNNWKIAVIWFSVSLLMAIVSTLPINSFLNTTLGESLESIKLANGFDYTVVIDLLNNYGIASGSIMNIALITVLFFLLFNIFFQAGWMATRADNFMDESQDYFWNYGAKFFLRFLGISVIFTIFQMLWVYLVFQLFMNMTYDMNIFMMESEAVITNSLWILIPLLLIGNGLIKLGGDYARAYTVEHDPQYVTAAILPGFRSVFMRLLKTVGLYLIIVLISIAAGAFYGLLADWLPDSSFGLIGFLLFQLYALARIFIRMIHLAGVVKVFQQA